MMKVLLILFYLTSPALILYLCKKFPFLDKLGAVGIAYVIGLLLGNIGILNSDYKVIQDTINSIAIPLALPLLLLSINLKQWSRLAGRTALSMFLGIIAIVTAIVIGHYLFRSHINDCWKVSGLLTGVYLGATFNMAAIQLALKVDNEVYGIVNAYDILACGVYFMFIISVAQRLFNKILPSFKKSLRQTDDPVVEENYEGWDAYQGIFSKKILLPLSIALGVSILIAAVAGAISMFFPKEYLMATVILIITTLSILTSQISSLNKIKMTFQTGIYLIMIFCVVVGSMADLSLFTKTSIYVLYYVIEAIVGSIVLHVLLAWIFKIDTDTVIVSSSAMIFSPPFVPAIANALHNKEIILSGITVGIVGYSIGNYIGIGLAYLLR